MIDKETIEEKAVEYVLATFYEDYSTEEKKDILKENSRYFRDKVNLFIKAYDMGQNDEFEFNNRMAIRNAKKMKELEKENTRLSKMLNEAIDIIEQEDIQCKMCSFFSSCRDEYCAYKDEIPTFNIIRAELEKRVKG